MIKNKNKKSFIIKNNNNELKIEKQFLNNQNSFIK